MQRQQWEYATLYWEGEGLGERRWVLFTSGERWEPIKGDIEAYTQTLRRLGESGFEMVSVSGEPLDYGLNRKKHVLTFKRPLSG